MFDKQYYDNKFKVLKERLGNKQINFISDVLNLASRYASEERNFKLESQELKKRMDGGKNETVILDTKGEPIKKEVKKEVKKETKK